MLNGFLVVDKEKGITSAHVVGKVKHFLYLIGEKDTKIGHFGTLDPDGEGVLPIAFGRATRLFPYQEGKEKVYQTEFQFGVLTDTLDMGGNVLATSDKIPAFSDVQNTMEKMRGKSFQIPPQYSSKSLGGVRAYKAARNGVFLDLPPKEIEIFEVNHLKQIENEVFSMEITVSSGTYIRAIARDLGQFLGTYCSMRYIKRLKSGVFGIENAVKLDALTEHNFLSSVLPIDIFLSGFPRYDVPIELSRIILTGSELYGLDDLPDFAFTVFLDGKLLGIGEKTEENHLRIKTWLL